MAGYNPRYLGMAGDEAAARAKAYWGPGVYEGDPVDIRKSQHVAQERFIEVLNANPRAPVVMPLEYIVDPAVIRKAIFDPSFSSEMLSNEIRKAKQNFVDDLDPATIRKAGNTSTNSMVHATWDTEVEMLFRRAVHPIQAIIRTEACLGKYAQWDAIGPTGGASAAYVSENPVFAGGEFTPGSRVEACKIAASDGYVTQMAQFSATAQTPARDPTAVLTEACNEALRELKDRGLLGVSRDTTLGLTSFEDAPAIAFPGIYELINNNTAAPNWVTAAAATNTWEKLEPYIQTVYTNMLQDKIVPDVAICDFKTFFMICRGLEKYYLSENLKTTEYGIQTLTLQFPRGPLPVVPMEQLPTTTGANGVFEMLDSTRLAYRQLWGPMFQLLANENGNQHFLINEAGLLIDKTDIDASSSLQGAVLGITI
jgi:hypothetical protein